MDNRRTFGRETWKILVAVVYRITINGNYPPSEIWRDCPMISDANEIRLLWSGEWAIYGEALEWDYCLPLVFG